jgi:hypothetical protein
MRKVFWSHRPICNFIGVIGKGLIAIEPEESLRSKCIEGAGASDSVAARLGGSSAGGTAPLGVLSRIEAKGSFLPR